MRAAAVLALLSAFGIPAAAQVYVGSSSNGTIVLSNFPSADAPKELLSEAGAPPRDTAAHLQAPLPPAGSNAGDLNAIVLRVAQELDLAPQLLHAIIAVESAYDPRAESPKGAQGLMQLMPATARRFGVRDPFDPHDNVRGGAQYLKSLLAQFNGDLQLALAAYNAGENAVARHGNRVPPFEETRKYVPKVIARMRRAERS